MSDNKRQKNIPAFTSNSETFIEGRVFSVILDDTHPKYSGEDSIGVIFYGDVSLNEGDNPKLRRLNKAKPYFSFIKQYPVKYEIVKIWVGTSANQYTKTRGDKNQITNFYFPPTNTHNSSNHNATPLESDIPQQAENSSEASLGIQQNETPTDNELFLGEDFNEDPQVKKLQPFEGDVTIEGRHGQGIRFGSTSKDREKNNWSDNEGKDDPITIISNGIPKTDADATIEDINQTDSIIVMTSNQNINNLEVASNNMQSIGTEFEEPLGEDIIIVNTPDPVVSPPSTPDPVPFTNKEPVIIEQVPASNIPTEIETSPIIEGDPIFALLDEAVESGEIEPLIDEIFTIAASEPDEDSPDGTSPNTNNSTAPVNSNFKNQNWPSLKTDWRNGRNITVYNKLGATTNIPQPTEALNPSNSTTRNIKYLWIHTTGTLTSSNPVDIWHLHLKGNNWEKGGYHWLLPRTGRGACRMYSDNVISNGVGGKLNRSQSFYGVNKNAINISWIGGANGLDITQQQAYTLKRLVLNYVSKYPDIKVGGHNQMGRSNKNGSVPGPTECPIFYVPRYCELIGLEEKNIFRGGYFGLTQGAEPNTNKYISNAETVFDLGGR